MSQERELQPASGGSRCIGTLEALLRVRQDMQQGRLFLHFGDALVERLAGYVEGYRACVRENGLSDDRYGRFCDWLKGVKQGSPAEEDPGRYLREFHGDHERAIRMYLELVAEFSAFDSDRSMAVTQESESRCSEGRARAMGVMDCLLRTRQEMQQGRLCMRVCDVNAERFNAFVDGYNACMEANGLSDGRYVRFRDWLRDVKQELPGEGWPVKYLRDCRGDHGQAIRKYLDFAAEFAALQGGVVDSS